MNPFQIFPFSFSSFIFFPRKYDHRIYKLLGKRKKSNPGKCTQVNISNGIMLGLTNKQAVILNSYYN